MLIFRGGNWPEHRPWFFGIIAASAAAMLWYGLEGYRSGSWPGGSSRPGFAFGIVGGLIIVFEMLLWVRKKFRVVRIGRAKLWMKAHIWLGLLCVPLLVLHSGFRGWNLALAGILMAVLLIVIASGIWGLVLQQILPTFMLDEIPAETIRSQIDYVLRQLLEEAAVWFESPAASPAGQTMGDIGTGQSGETFLVIGAVRSVGQGPGEGLANADPGDDGDEFGCIAPVLRGARGAVLRGQERVAGCRSDRPSVRRPCSASSSRSSTRRHTAWRTSWRASATSAGSSHTRRGSIPGCTSGSASICRSRSALLVLMIAHVFYALKYF